MLNVLVTTIICVFSPSSYSEIKLLKLDWTSQRVLTHVLGNLMESKGVEISYVHAPAKRQWFQIVNGQADVQVEIWEGTMGKKFESLLSKGFIKLGTTHTARTREEWWYPSYVKELCPGLPDWKSLRGCYKLFSTGGKRGVYHSGPWGKSDVARIRSLDLPFDIVELSNSEDITSLINTSISKREPFLVFNWTPNWVDIAYSGSFIEFPEYHEKCETKASWGIDPQRLWDCGNPKNGWIKIAVSNGIAEKSKCARDIISSFKLSNEDISRAAYIADYKGKSEAAAASEWLELNSNRIHYWTGHASCKGSD